MRNLVWIGLALTWTPAYQTEVVGRCVWTAGLLDVISKQRRHWVQGRIHGGGKGLVTGGWSHYPQSGSRGGWMTVLSSFLFLFNLRPQPLAWCHPYSGWVLLPELAQSRNPFTDMPRDLPLCDSRFRDIVNQDAPSQVSGVYSTADFMYLHIKNVLYCFKISDGPLDPACITRAPCLVRGMSHPHHPHEKRPIDRMLVSNVCFLCSFSPSCPMQEGVWLFLNLRFIQGSCKASRSLIHLYSRGSSTSFCFLEHLRLFCTVFLNLYLSVFWGLHCD